MVLESFLLGLVVPFVVWALTLEIRYRRLSSELKEIWILSEAHSSDGRHFRRGLDSVSRDVLECVQKLGAIEKSTHRVQYIPADSASMLGELKTQVDDLGVQGADPHIERLEALIKRATSIDSFEEI